MTVKRYLEWKRDIAQARADGDTEKLASLQLDYNLEIGECLSHQSQRTKDIKDELVGLKASLGSVTTAIRLMDGRMGTLEAALIRTADNLSVLTTSVQDLISYRNGLVMKQEGAKLAGKTVKAVAVGVSVVVTWAYAIYQFVVSLSGK